MNKPAETRGFDTHANLFGDAAPRELLSRERKAEIELANRQSLEADLLSCGLEYASRPHTVFMQLSNFCNMSCTMCYDGENPPLSKMPPDLVAKAADEVFPTASVMLPFAGSEPLVLTWETARRLAEIYKVELDIVTNVQYLDEAKFAELEPHVGTIQFSIDSHLPDLYERIRLRANRDKVFRNLPVAAKLCREAGIEVILNAVLMSENAAWMPETVAYMADAGIPTIHILRYLHNLPHKRFSDPGVSFTPAYLEDLRERCRAVAEDKKVKLIWDVAPPQQYDYRDNGVSYRKSRARDAWLWKLEHYLPGYCAQSVYSIKIDADGTCYPCCVGDGGVLAIGDLKRQNLEEIWNGPEARDLRRGMMTWDVPAKCRGCGAFEYRTGEKEHLPFVEAVTERIGHYPPNPVVESLGPDHLTRTREAPVLSWEALDRRFDRYVLALGLGGEKVEILEFELPADAHEFRFCAQDWKRLRANFAYWWCVLGIDVARPDRSVRSRTIRCLIRDEPMQRVCGSSLEY